MCITLWLALDKLGSQKQEDLSKDAHRIWTCALLHKKGLSLTNKDIPFKSDPSLFHT